MERLQKVLARAGIASRRKAEELIVQGRVKVNGTIVNELGVLADSEQDQIEVDGQLVQSAEKNVYYIFYKPTGVITSVSDPQGRKVVMDFFREVKERIYPVGRLDFDTSGLLLLTNDGTLAHQLMHPSFQIEKSYLATVQGVPTPYKLARLEKGIELKDGWTAPAKAELVSQQEQGKKSLIRLRIHEGRNRQVRRMCKAIGHPVLQLHRERYGCLSLAGLKQGEYRELNRAEVAQLKEMTSHKFHK